MDETALADQATAAGDEWVASRDDIPESWKPLLHSVFCVGWIHGRQAGGLEALAVMKLHTARLLKDARS